MKEIDLIKLAIKEIEKNFLYSKIWRSRSFNRRLRSDIFNCFDLIYYTENDIISLVQITTLANVSARRKKILNYFKPLSPPNNCQIWAWDKKIKDFRYITL